MKADSLAESTKQKWPRRGLLLGLGLLLFALGQFQEAVFAGLTCAWRFVSDALGPAGWQQGQPSSLSTHGLPVGISYRLLYCGLSALILHVLLRGHATYLIAAGYASALLLSLLLLLLGQRMSLPLASEQGHRLLDLICSPLPMLIPYFIKVVGNLAPDRSSKSPFKTRQLTRE